MIILEQMIPEDRLLRPIHRHMAFRIIWKLCDPLYCVNPHSFGQKRGYVIGDRDEPITLQPYRWMFKGIKNSVNLYDATARVFSHSHLAVLDVAEANPKTLPLTAVFENFGFTMNRYVHGRRTKTLEAGRNNLP